ncbi:MAG: PAS domain-containing protein [Alphaproteobacteria bacterium]|nr:PAS domain-containing protein [Alphaproteobacteria bacterium]
MGNRFARVRLEAFPQSLEHPTLAFLHEYWHRKRGQRVMPSRKDIIPSEIKEHLGWVIMIDVLPGMTDFRYRLIGTLVTQYFGWDATGKTISEAWDKQSREAVNNVYKLLRSISESRMVMSVSGDTDWGDIGLEPFQSIYLPLSDDGENVDRILHAFVFNEAEVLLARQIAREKPTKLPQRGAPLGLPAH